MRSGIRQPRVPMEPEVFAVAQSVQGSRGAGQIRHHPRQHCVPGPDRSRSGAPRLFQGHGGGVQRAGGAEKLVALGPGHDRRGSGVDGERCTRRTDNVGHSQNTRVQVRFFKTFITKKKKKDRACVNELKVKLLLIKLYNVLLCCFRAIPNLT